MISLALRLCSLLALRPISYPQPDTLVTPAALTAMSQTLKTADVASHNKANDLWIIVDEDVYDLTKFQEEHPGGKKSVS